MTENENFLQHVGNSAGSYAKKISLYLGIGILSIAVIFGAGLLNLWKNLKEGKMQRLQVAAGYLERYLKDTEAFTADELLAYLIDGRSVYVLVEQEVSFFYVYDNETERLIGTGDISRVQKLYDQSDRKIPEIKGWQYYELYAGDNCTVILESDMNQEKTDFLKILPSLLVILGIVSAMYIILIWIFLYVISNEKARNRVISGVLFTLLSVLIAADAFTALKYQISLLTQEEKTLYQDASSYISTIGEMSDEEIGLITNSKDAASGRLELVDNLMSLISSDDYTATYNAETVFDEDTDIFLRVTILPDVKSYLNRIFQYLLETVMYAVLAVLIFWSILYYRTYFGGERTKTDSVRRSMDLLKVISTAKSFADALTITVAVTLLKSFLNEDCSEWADAFVNFTILAASLIGMAGAFLLPLFIRLTRGSARLMPLSMLLCTAGSLMCFLAEGSLLFVIGYLVIAAGDTIFGMMFLMVPYEIVPDDRHPMREVSKINVGRYDGQIIGYVVGGTLAVMLPYRFMFLIAFGLLVLMLIPAVMISRMEKQRELPAKAFFFKTVRNRRFLKFLLLIQAPYAMVSYYFRYVVPLNVQELNQTITLVSFLFFFRMLMRMIFKQQDSVKAFWKKFRLKTAVLICMVVTAGLFALMQVFYGVLGMIICTMLIALVEARFSSLVVRLGYEILDNNVELFFGCAAAQTISRKFGKSLATSITQAAGPFAIPVWMGGSAVLYLLLTIRDGKKNKEEKT